MRAPLKQNLIIQTKMNNYYSSLSTSKANRLTNSSAVIGLLAQSWKECIHFAEEQERLVCYLSIYILQVLVFALYLPEDSNASILPFSSFGKMIEEFVLAVYYVGHKFHCVHFYSHYLCGLAFLRLSCARLVTISPFLVSTPLF